MAKNTFTKSVTVNATVAPAVSEVKEEEVLEEETELDTLEVTPVLAPKDVEVNINTAFSVYLGNQLWHFKVGKDYVPEHVKQYLSNVKALSPI